MKKRKLYFLILCLIFCACVSLFAACGGCDGGEGSEPKIETEALAVPSVTIGDDGIAVWDAVEHASGYRYKIDGGSETPTDKTSVTLTDGQSVAVKAVGDGARYTDSEWSAVKKYTAPQKPPVEPVEPKQLGAPALTVLRDGSVSWPAVANAVGYLCSVNGGEALETQARTALLRDGEKIEVRATGDGVKYSDGPAASITYTAPKNAFAAPENLTVCIDGTERGRVILEWDAVAGVRGYDYIVNGDTAHPVTVTDTRVTVDLDAAKLGETWSFRVRTLDDGSSVEYDGNYSARYDASAYCGEAEFRVPRGDEKVYGVTDILKVIRYFGDRLPADEFTVCGLVAGNTEDIILEENYKTLLLHGADVSADFDIIYDDMLAGCTVTARGRLSADGLAVCTAALDAESAAERYALAVSFLDSFGALSEGREHTSDFSLPTKLYGVSAAWFSDSECLSVDGGAVTVNRPAVGEEDGLAVVSAILCYGDDVYAEELEYLLSVPAKKQIILNAPKISIDPNTGVATWTAVENAVGYFYIVLNNYNIPTGEEDIVETTVSVKLEKGYTIQVQAVGDGTEYLDSDWVQKTYNYHPETVDPAGRTLTFNFSGAKKNAYELKNPKPIFTTACGGAADFKTVTTSNVYLGNTVDTASRYGDGFIRVGTAKNNGTIKLTFGGKVNGVKIKCQTWDKDSHDKVSVNGSAEQTAAKNDWGVLTFNFTSASDTVEIVTNKRVFILEITVYLAE